MGSYTSKKATKSEGIVVSITGTMTPINFDFLQSNNITHVRNGEFFSALLHREFFSTLFQPQENPTAFLGVDKKLDDQ